MVDFITRMRTYQRSGHKLSDRVLDARLCILNLKFIVEKPATSMGEYNKRVTTVSFPQVSLDTRLPGRCK